MEVARPILGGFMSAECFRYLRMDAEETAGRALIVTAGKQRGRSLADFLKGIKPDDTAKIAETLGKILGVEGTRLCLVKEVIKTDDGYTFKIDESACSYGLKADVPTCAYTLGVFAGAVEIITGKRAHGVEHECQAIGSKFCVYQVELLS